jgi:hypothetical protein
MDYQNQPELEGLEENTLATEDESANVEERGVRDDSLAALMIRVEDIWGA